MEITYRTNVLQGAEADIYVQGTNFVYRCECTAASDPWPSTCIPMSITKDVFKC